MQDQFGRKIDYMRISVTDRCNLRCRYCMPEGGIDSLPMSEMLSFEEIIEVCKMAADFGITKIRLTGGEPLVRLELPKLVRMIKSIPQIKKLNLTTNGILLNRYLDELTDAGLDGLNISLDTLDRAAFARTTGFDKLEQVLTAIRRSLDAGLSVKVNAVLLPDSFFLEPRKGEKIIVDAGEGKSILMKSSDMGVAFEEPNWYSMLSLARDYPIDLRFIELMPIGEGQQFEYMSADVLMQELRKRFPALEEDHNVHGNGPAVYYRIPGFQGSIGLIEAIHGKFCDGCNRIRLTATGKVKPCLCYATTYDLKTLLRSGKSDEAKELLGQAIYGKPKEHCFEELAEISEEHKMVSIGG